MKKLLICTMCVMMMLSACGAKNEPASAPSEDIQSSEANAEKDLLELAKSCQDKSVDELYALIGEPASSEYISSCLGDGEDGTLNYGDFVVYTYKDAQGETVKLVE